ASNAFMYNALLQKPSSWEEKQALFRAIPDSCLSIHNLTAFMKQAIKSNDFETVVDVFKKTQRKGIANVVTYTSFIDAAGKHGRFEEAKEAFEEAKRRGL